MVVYTPVSENYD